MCLHLKKKNIYIYKNFQGFTMLMTVKRVITVLWKGSIVVTRVLLLGSIVVTRVLLLGSIVVTRVLLCDH